MTVRPDAVGPPAGSDGVPARPGRLITVEGIEGSGKSTQARRLAEWLVSRGARVTTTSEPDGTALGLEVRRVLGALGALEPLAECLLFAAARAEHVRRVIRPALAAGRTVVCDRYTDSTVAYQGYGRGLPLAAIACVNRAATDGLEPDLTLVLDLDPEAGLARVRTRRPVTAGTGAAPAELVDPFERLGTEFHDRVRQGYRLLGEREPGRVVVVDARASIDRVAAAVREVVLARLGSVA